MSLKIFVSFEYDKDNDLRGHFYTQAKKYSTHRIQDCSLRQDYPTEEWKAKARSAISGCDVVIVLVGADTHNAPVSEPRSKSRVSSVSPCFRSCPRKDRMKAC